MNIIDLFSGCGGLSEGFRSNAFNIICHVEMDNDACKSLQTREAYYHLKKENNLKIYKEYISGDIDRSTFLNSLPHNLFSKIIKEEINEHTLANIFDTIDSLLGRKQVDGIIGGPPCQAYSTIGRGRNKEKKEFDERIYLYEYYIEFLQKYQPAFFLFENVKGLLSFKDSDDELLFPKMKTAFAKAGYNLSEKLINSKNYGVPQSRERLFIFGEKKKTSSNNFFCLLNKEKMDCITINEIFNDLPFMNDGDTKNKYVNSNISNYTKTYFRKDSLPLSQNICRPHNKRDKEIYRIVALAKEQGLSIKYNNLPRELQAHKNTSSFLDRYKAIDGNSFSHTIVAHISKDGHYYIHPDVKQNRSISVREAARIQSFPDDYFFESSRTSAFKQIGNAVPPLLSKKLAYTISAIYS